MCSLGKSLLILHFILKGQNCLLLQVSLDFCIPVPYDEKDIFFGVSSRSCCRSSENCSTSAFLAPMVRTQTWIIVMLNGLPWKWTEIMLSILRLQPSNTFDSFVDYVVYAIPSEGFLATRIDIVVDIMFILIKFAHSHLF